MKIRLIAVAALALLVGFSASAEHVKGYTRKDGTYVAPYERGSTRTTPSPLPNGTPPATTTAPGVERDAEGHIKRSEKAKDDFKKSHPCPSTLQTSGPCPGYVIDHVIALKHGGADDPSNMQWQTVEEAKAKDRVE